MWGERGHTKALDGGYDFQGPGCVLTPGLAEEMLGEAQATAFLSELVKLGSDPGSMPHWVTIGSRGPPGHL